MTTLHAWATLKVAHTPPNRRASAKSPTISSCSASGAPAKASAPPRERASSSRPRATRRQVSRSSGMSK